MILYSNTAVAFRDDVDSNQIVDKIDQKFQEKLGHCASRGEMLAWRNSLRCMESIVRNSKVADDCGIMIEYVIPNTSNRVDFIITGEDDAGDQNYVVVELKQWEQAESTDIPDLVHTFVGQGYRNVNHPSYQADSYNRMMKNMNEGIYGNGIGGHACAYLHNYKEKSPEPLLESKYQHLVKAAPIYFLDDYRELQNYLKKMVGKGKGMDVLYQIEKGRIKPSKKLVEYVDSLYAGNDDFILFDEQNVAYNTILKELEQIDKKKTIIVKGGPGTGKSVISFKILHAMIDRRLNAKFVAPNEAFREVMVKKLIASKVDKVKNIKPLFGGSSIFYGVPKNAYDVLIVDEAHRLKGKGAFMYKGENQVQDIIHSSILNVFFVDDFQRIRKVDIGTVDEIKRIAALEGSEVIEMELKAQFRCAGAEGFVNWITHTLQIEDTANFDGWDEETFEFKMFEDPNEMYRKIVEKNQDGNKSRMVAGFAWEWSEETDASINDVQIPEWNFAMPWNARKDRALFAIKEDSVNQIGCIHTVQGLEFDYVGVIIGDDLTYNYNTGLIEANFGNYKDSSGKMGLKGNPEELTKLVKNIYKVLLSRGTKGCYLYCRDYGLRSYFKTRLGIEEEDIMMAAENAVHYRKE